MNLVEAPDHAGPVAPPHAPERLRTLLAEGRNAQNDETAQSERAGFSPLKLNLDSYSESNDSNIFALGWSLWRGGSPSRGFLLSLNRLNLLPGMYVLNHLVFKNHALRSAPRGLHQGGPGP